MDWNLKFINDKIYSVDNDRFKEKRYVFSPFPPANMHGFQDGDIRHIVLADIMARYMRMENHNVLYPTGFNSLTKESFQECKKLYKSLDDKSVEVFYDQMVKMGIGIDDQKCINMRHAEYVSLLQNAFIEFYERNYIKYKPSLVYYDKELNEIYDSFEGTGKKSFVKCFTLDVAGILPQVVDDINHLDLDDASKEDLIQRLLPKEVLQMDFLMSNGEALEIEMEEPEYMGGISYIFLNPNYLDIRKYVSIDEYGSVKALMETEEALYAFSGLTAKNPLTGLDIPIFISKLYSKGIYLGIPDVDSEDRLLVENEGFDYLTILKDGLFINSDILDGYTIEEGKKKIIEAFTEAEMARVTKVYQNSEILVSSYECFGALIPFLEDKDGIHSIKDFLPYIISLQFRPVLLDNVSIPGEPIFGTIHTNFTEGMLPILSILYDNIGSIESVFSLDNKKAFEDWLPIDVAYIPKNEIVSGLLMPIILYNIIKKEVSYSLPRLFNKIVLLPRALDVHQKTIKRQNNNLIDMDKYLEKFDSNTIRLLCGMTKIEDEMIFDIYYLSDLKEYISKIEVSLESAVESKRPNLDYHFHLLQNKLKNCLDDKDIKAYVDILKEFNERILFKEIISKQQALDYLKIIYPIFPELSERLYNQLFNGRYSIVNEGWPN